MVGIYEILDTMEENNSAQTAQEPQPQFVPHTFIAQNVPEQNQTTGNKPKTNYLLIILIIVFVNIAIIGALTFLIMPSRNAKNKIPKTITSNTNNPLPQDSASNNSQTISSLNESAIILSPTPTTSTSSDYTPTLIETKEGTIKMNLSKQWQRSENPLASKIESEGLAYFFNKKVNHDAFDIMVVRSKTYMNTKDIQMKYLKKIEDSFVLYPTTDYEVLSTEYKEMLGVVVLELTGKIKRVVSNREIYTYDKYVFFAKNWILYTIYLTEKVDENLLYPKSREEFEKEWGEFEKNSLNTIEFIN